MAFAVTHDFSTGETVEASEVNQNFADVEALVNGSLTTTNLSSSAGITNSQLANSHFEIILNLSVHGTVWATGAVGEVVAMAGLPCDTTSTDYTIMRVEWSMSCPGTAITGTAPKFDLDFGYFGSTSSDWTNVKNIVDGQSTGTVAVNRGTAGVCTLANSAVTTSTTNKQFFALRVDTVGTDFSAAGQVLCVSIALKRTNGLRS